jgi:conjugative transposon TraN protein
MKKINVVMITGVFLVLTSINAFSQNAIEDKASVIEPYHLTIAYFKTSNLIFPYAIKSVDRGSEEVLAQKARGVENILQVKAAKKGFDETNLTVITADGKLYSYILNYADNPARLNLQFGNLDKSGNDTDALFSFTNHNEAETRADAAQVTAEKRTVHGIKDKKYAMRFKLNGLFVRGDVMYYQIKIANRSNINYDIDQLRFFIRDQKKSKRTATQEIEIKPLYVQNDTAAITGQSERILVFALPKFTIPDKKYLAIQLMEKNGGRHLNMQVHNRTIVKAKLLM